MDLCNLSISSVSKSTREACTLHIVKLICRSNQLRHFCYSFAHALELFLDAYKLAVLSGTANLFVYVQQLLNQDTELNHSPLQISLLPQFFLSDAFSHGIFSVDSMSRSAWYKPLM